MEVTSSLKLSQSYSLPPASGAGIGRCSCSQSQLPACPLTCSLHEKEWWKMQREEVSQGCRDEREQDAYSGPVPFEVLSFMFFFFFPLCKFERFSTKATRGENDGSHIVAPNSSSACLWEWSECCKCALQLGLCFLILVWCWDACIPSETHTETESPL